MTNSFSWKEQTNAATGNQILRSSFSLNLATPSEILGLCWEVRGAETEQGWEDFPREQIPYRSIPEPELVSGWIMHGVQANNETLAHKKVLLFRSQHRVCKISTIIPVPLDLSLCLGAAGWGDGQIRGTSEKSISDDKSFAK